MSKLEAATSLLGPRSSTSRAERRERATRAAVRAPERTRLSTHDAGHCRLIVCPLRKLDTSGVAGGALSKVNLILGPIERLAGPFSILANPLMPADAGVAGFALRVLLAL